MKQSRWNETKTKIDDITRGFLIIFMMLGKPPYKYCFLIGAYAWCHHFSPDVITFCFLVLKYLHQIFLQSIPKTRLAKYDQHLAKSNVLQWHKWRHWALSPWKPVNSCTTYSLIWSLREVVIASGPHWVTCPSAGFVNKLVAGFHGELHDMLQLLLDVGGV